MKYLEIKDNKGFFLRKDGIYTMIDLISKDDLYYLLERAIEDDFLMDEYNADELINPAHSIIYETIYKKFQELMRNKSRFKDESTQLYREAIEKYRTLAD